MDQVRDTLGMRVFNVFNVLLMLCLMLVTAYPILYVLFGSLSKPSQFMMHKGPLLYPAGFHLGSYRLVFSDPQILTGLLNTVIVLVCKLGLSMLLTIIGAYCLSYRGTLFIPYLTFAIVFTMFFNGGLVPTYLNIRSMGMLNSRVALIIPSAINTFNLIVLRTAFSGVPSSLEEAAAIDGAGPVRRLFTIMLPLVKPTLMVCVLYYGVATWNSWFDAMIYLRKKELFPLQLVLREILITNDTTSITNQAADTEMLSLTIQYAVMMVATLPILLLYPFLQKHFVKGVMIGAVKG